MRAISLDAGLGPNFAQQVTKGERDPSAGHLTKLLGEFPESRRVYILTGLAISEHDLSAIKRLDLMKPGPREAFENFLDQLAADEDTPTPAS